VSLRREMVGARLTEARRATLAGQSKGSSRAADSSATPRSTLSDSRTSRVGVVTDSSYLPLYGRPFKVKQRLF
jgi:hypothetical protein